MHTINDKSKEKIKKQLLDKAGLSHNYCESFLNLVFREVVHDGIKVDMRLFGEEKLLKKFIELNLKKNVFVTASPEAVFNKYLDFLKSLTDPDYMHIKDLLLKLRKNWTEKEQEEIIWYILQSKRKITQQNKSNFPSQDINTAAEDVFLDPNVASSTLEDFKGSFKKKLKSQIDKNKTDKLVALSENTEKIISLKADLYKKDSSEQIDTLDKIHFTLQIIKAAKELSNSKNIKKLLDILVKQIETYLESSVTLPENLKKFEEAIRQKYQQDTSAKISAYRKLLSESRAFIKKSSLKNQNTSRKRKIINELIHIQDNQDQTDNSIIFLRSHEELVRITSILESFMFPKPRGRR
jgi:RecG-like helicase